MKKILLISSALLFIGCGNDDDNDNVKECVCTRQKYERSATYKISDGTLVSATEWSKVGNVEPSDVVDCSYNGKAVVAGSSNFYSGTINYSKTEFEYRLTCQ